MYDFSFYEKLTIESIKCFYDFTEEEIKALTDYIVNNYEKTNYSVQQILLYIKNDFFQTLGGTVEELKTKIEDNFIKKV